jgi:hypothetical protein
LLLLHFDDDDDDADDEARVASSEEEDELCLGTGRFSVGVTEVGDGEDVEASTAGGESSKGRKANRGFCFCGGALDGGGG